MLRLIKYHYQYDMDSTLRNGVEKLSTTNTDYEILPHILDDTNGEAALI